MTESFRIRDRIPRYASPLSSASAFPFDRLCIMPGHRFFRFPKTFGLRFRARISRNSVPATLFFGKSDPPRLRRLVRGLAEREPAALCLSRGEGTSIFPTGGVLRYTCPHMRRRRQRANRKRRFQRRSSSAVRLLSGKSHDSLPSSALENGRGVPSGLGETETSRARRVLPSQGVRAGGEAGSRIEAAGRKPWAKARAGKLPTRVVPRGLVSRPWKQGIGCKGRFRQGERQALFYWIAWRHVPATRRNGR